LKIIAVSEVFRLFALVSSTGRSEAKGLNDSYNRMISTPEQTTAP
jgi:hypothetical protein